MTLFLDRDGVINCRKPTDYIRNKSEFVFEKGALEAINQLSFFFEKIIVVTNQQGIGKGFMSEADLAEIHQFLIEKTGGKIVAALHCPHLKTELCACRKPESGMAFQAKKMFPEIDFQKSWMVGDSASDIEFGQKLGMKTVWIHGKPEDFDKITQLAPDFQFDSLEDFAQNFIEKQTTNQTNQKKS
jgi:D-glycero-D-manno-heptose 1,7-bisphosphate phosphatase